MAFGIDDAIAAGLTVLNKFIPDPEAKQRAEAELRASLFAVDASQNAVNAAEAANDSVFVAGWRPFIGWVCGSAVAYTYMLVPLGVWLSNIAGHPIPKPPTLDNNLWELMFAMLGMGGLRSWEKIKGVRK